MERALSKEFEKLPKEINILLFTQTGKNDAFSKVAKDVIRYFQQLTDKIILKEFDFDHDLAKKYKIGYAPTLLFEPEKYHIRWMGAPMGEEGRTFLEVLLLIGNGKSDLSEQSAAMMATIDGKREIKTFVSATCPYCPQQAVNTLKAAIEKPEFISLEIVDIQANPELAAKYSAQSVPQVYVNDQLIAKGAQPEELFIQSLQKMEELTVYIPDRSEAEVETDVVIVGGGPAGLTAGIYAARSGLKAVIIEKGALGGQMANTPVIENYPGLKHVGGKTLVDIMVTHAMEYADIFPGEEVIEISSGEVMKVKTSRRRFIAKAVLLATGAIHRRLGLAAEARLAGHGVSYCSTCDGPLFKGKDIIIVGGGSSAVTEALNLKNIGVNVTLVHRRDQLKAQDVLVKKLKQDNIPVFYDTEVNDILGKHQVEEVKLYNRKTKKTTTMPVAGVFISIGYIPEVELAQKTGIKTDKEGYIAQEHYRTNVHGVYTAGDVTGGFKQIVTAAGQGAGAAMTIFEDIVHPYWAKTGGDEKEK